MTKKKVLILGAAGRDFHNFNVLFRGDASIDVKAFTAAQIPGIENRTYPPSLAGRLYPKGIPIISEDELTSAMEKHSIDAVVFSYSDVSHERVMHLASTALSNGADFMLPGPRSTMLKSKRPVVSVTAVRTGCGKSGISRYAARIARSSGLKPVIMRHPMPYGDLEKMRVQRFASRGDLAGKNLTIEEREEYEPIVTEGFVVYAGVDYAEILRAAEKESDLIIWDGGNNDFSFIKPDLSIVVLDALRPGHETLFHPGETNLRSADLVVINKADMASTATVKLMKESVRLHNPKAKAVKLRSRVTVENGPALRSKKVLVIEDGPTLTHGGMSVGAGTVAARESGAVPIDPLPFAKGSIRTFLEERPMKLVPAMGYSAKQIKELAETINSAVCDAVLVATPVDLSSLIKINKPAMQVRYEVEEIDEQESLRKNIETFLKRAFRGGRKK